VSVYFVYRSHDDNPGAFHVKVFPHDTVLEWCRSIWVGIPRGDDHPDAATDRAEEVLGCVVGGFDMLFVTIHNQAWAKPKTMTAAARYFEEALYNQAVKFGQHHLQLLGEDDDLQTAVYLFDDHYVNKNRHRATFLMRTDWRLPDGASEEELKPKGVPNTAKLVRGVGVTYFAHFATYDIGMLSDLPNRDLRGVVAAVRVADFPRYLFAMRNRLAENPDDETLSHELCQLVRGLDVVIEKAKGDEKAFLAALTADPDDYGVWCAYSYWRMERDRLPLLADVLLLYEPYWDAIEGTRQAMMDDALTQTHVAQLSKHVGRLEGGADRFHHFILFDDEWANAHRDLAASILRTASRWDPL